MVRETEFALAATGGPFPGAVDERALETLVKLELLADGSSDCPLLRLFDFTPAEARQLRAVAGGLASGVTDRIEIDQLPFVQSLGGCRLALVCRSWDQAVARVGPSEFECGFTAGTWEHVAGLVEPFAEGAGGFQWLADSPGEAALLLSPSGRW